MDISTSGLWLDSGDTGLSVTRESRSHNSLCASLLRGEGEIVFRFCAFRSTDLSNAPSACPTALLLQDYDNDLDLEKSDDLQEEKRRSLLKRQVFSVD